MKEGERCRKTRKIGENIHFLMRSYILFLEKTTSITRTHKWPDRASANLQIGIHQTDRQTGIYVFRDRRMDTCIDEQRCIQMDRYMNEQTERDINRQAEQMERDIRVTPLLQKIID